MATRRTHNKTRLGCGQCKKRRIKVISSTFAFRSVIKSEFFPWLKGGTKDTVGVVD